MKEIVDKGQVIIKMCLVQKNERGIFLTGVVGLSCNRRVDDCKNILKTIHDIDDNDEQAWDSVIF